MQVDTSSGSGDNSGSNGNSVSGSKGNQSQTTPDAPPAETAFGSITVTSQTSSEVTTLGLELSSHIAHQIATNIARKHIGMNSPIVITNDQGPALSQVQYEIMIGRLRDAYVEAINLKQVLDSYQNLQMALNALTDAINLHKVNSKNFDDNIYYLNLAVYPYGFAVDQDHIKITFQKLGTFDQAIAPKDTTSDVDAAAKELKVAVESSAMTPDNIDSESNVKIMNDAVSKYKKTVDTGTVKNLLTPVVFTSQDITPIRKQIERLIAQSSLPGEAIAKPDPAYYDQMRTLLATIGFTFRPMIVTQYPSRHELQRLLLDDPSYIEPYNPPSKPKVDPDLLKKLSEVVWSKASTDSKIENWNAILGASPLAESDRVRLQALSDKPTWEAQEAVNAFVPSQPSPAAATQAQPAVAASKAAGYMVPYVGQAQLAVDSVTGLVRSVGTLYSLFRQNENITEVKLQLQGETLDAMTASYLSQVSNYRCYLSNFLPTASDRLVTSGLFCQENRPESEVLQLLEGLVQMSGAFQDYANYLKANSSLNGFIPIPALEQRDWDLVKGAGSNLTADDFSERKLADLAWQKALSADTTPAKAIKAADPAKLAPTTKPTPDKEATGHDKPSDDEAKAKTPAQDTLDSISTALTEYVAAIASLTDTLYGIPPAKPPATPPTKPTTASAAAASTQYGLLFINVQPASVQVTSTPATSTGDKTTTQDNLSTDGTQTDSAKTDATDSTKGGAKSAGDASQPISDSSKKKTSNTAGKSTDPAPTPLELILAQEVLAQKLDKSYLLYLNLGYMDGASMISTGLFSSSRSFNAGVGVDYFLFSPSGEIVDSGVESRQSPFLKTVDHSGGERLPTSISTEGGVHVNTDIDDLPGNVETESRYTIHSTFRTKAPGGN